jgi:glutamate-1-semialdehyde 2,1-aminomutase
MKTYSQSQQLFERAQDVLAGGVSSEFRKMSHPHPLFYTRAQGSRLWDVDNNEYLDFTLSQGPLILGHSRAEVLQAVASESQKGQLFAGQHVQELELAEFLQRVIPCAELMRFSLSGSECDHAAIRLARAATGRQKFIRFEGHYHGWFDNVALGISGANEESLGPRESPTPVPWTQGLPDRIGEEMIVLPWNDISLLEATLQKHAHEIAAIITEPVMCNNGCIAPARGLSARHTRTVRPLRHCLSFSMKSSPVFAWGWAARKSTLASRPISASSAKRWPTATRLRFWPASASLGQTRSR